MWNNSESIYPLDFYETLDIIMKILEISNQNYDELKKYLKPASSVEEIALEGCLYDNLYKQLTSYTSFDKMLKSDLTIKHLMDDTYIDRPGCIFYQIKETLKIVEPSIKEAGVNLTLTDIKCNRNSIMKIETPEKMKNESLNIDIDLD